MIIGNREFDTDNHTYIMGILNVTPDSFSDGGNYCSVESALARVGEMLQQGADIIDVGGESTRPGAEMVPEEEELRRVIPIISAIKREYNVPVSLDTYKPEVAAAGIEAGADMINDIWGLKYDKKMAEIIAAGQVACCLMHNRNTLTKAVSYDVVNAVCDDLKESLEIALPAGIAKERIVLDPGIGFAKNTDENLKIIREMKRIKAMGYPVLIGASRKSVIGNVLGRDTGERLYGTLAVTAYAVCNGAGILRVHDIEANRDVIKMLEAVKES